MTELQLRQSHAKVLYRVVLGHIVKYFRSRALSDFFIFIHTIVFVYVLRYITG